jgi:hypothetical protein
MREKDALEKNIKVGVQDFESIINEGLIYADKTKHIWNLARTEAACFLARPRRFGKTLLINTFEALFTGPRDPLEKPQGLFEGLWISGEEANYNFNDTYPVINLNLTVLRCGTPQELLGDLQEMIGFAAESYGLELKPAAPSIMFLKLIQSIYVKYQRKVVVLIDEYDYPIRATIHDADLMRANLITLNNFYSALKPQEKKLRFVMLTGVTRFAFLWGSGALNHLTDITMVERYADICGFTYEEFDNCFCDRFEIMMESFKEKGILGQMANVDDFRKIIFEMYDGYSWNGTTKVLNPYSLLNSFDNKDLNRYWATLEPSKLFLTSVFSHNPFDLTADKLEDYSNNEIPLSTTVDSLTPIPSLFQAGYLTLDKIRYVNSDNHSLSNQIIRYSFKIPNNEVTPFFDEGFSDSLFKFIKKDKREQGSAFVDAIKNEDSEQLSLLFDSLFSSIPALLHIAKEIYYHSVLYGYLRGLTGFSTTSEKAGADGTPDIFLAFDDGLKVIIEIKYKDLTSNEDRDSSTMKRLAILALETIRQKKYARPYLADAKKILRLGVGILGRGRALAILENEKEAAARQPAGDENP